MRSTYLLGMSAFVAAAAACSNPGSEAVAAQASTTSSIGRSASRGTATRSDDFQWGPAPDVFPAGAEMAVLQGDPSATGRIFTVRLRLPNGYILPAHWHPTDEHVTVIDGTFLVGVGDRFDESRFLPPLRPGGFITANAHMNHFAMARGRTVVQVHAVGPFAMTYVNPKDDPRRYADSTR